MSILQVYSLEGGIRSVDSQMMVAVTRPDKNLEMFLESHSNSIHVYKKANISKCIQVNHIYSCHLNSYVYVILFISIH